ncbi:DUF4238 domain-containing protein [Rhodanobacter sp. T12-5]|uniref:DUF4238 domain-containing protein n=1 Tax=Rhodanobacter sp. T12-5 TaxID=2024611 RepID=UPI0011EDDB5D|nr:DUF4238 domain-containing protein [Rhodanobacter sp. T12-5]KAA0072145.1 DUF4238 domain-containing protein [Rhodanobacter sp. T12-5]
MPQSKNRKKLHHYVHEAYLAQWRDGSNAIHILNPSTGKSFASTRRGVGAESRFNDFTFDPMVIDLLHYAFSRRLADKDPGSDAAEIMLSLVSWAKDMDYLHKEHNFFEDFYEIYENNIGITISQIKRAELAKPEGREDWGLNLLFFYFLQLFRVPKARGMLSGELIWSTPEGSTTLDGCQKREFTMLHMLINALCAACDAHALGFTIRLRYALAAGKIINSDAPAVVRSSGITRLEELRGWMPLTPRIAMELDEVGGGFRTVISEPMSRDTVDQYNRSMLENVHTHLYFSSASQCADYSRRIVRKSAVEASESSSPSSA